MQEDIKLTAFLSTNERSVIKIIQVAMFKGYILSLSLIL